MSWRPASQLTAVGTDAYQGDENKFQDVSHWLGVAGGFLSARPAPTNLAELRSWGATAVVTLLHGGERGIEVLRQGEERLGLKWQVAPVQPISNASRPVSAEDVVSFRTASLALEWLRQGEHVAVHCRAGFHRTGTFCYVLLRQSGKSPAEAMEALRTIADLAGDGDEDQEEATRLAREGRAGIPGPPRPT
ncbi:unnamed protein product [Prorocentrum cordatum]|uniref:Tyrosine specific protein phosphatases domain-containing protein n=1 Tax=Prorocentrum cordatum TaxID=2364126 RepID=A0ABN9WA33_9DINO|nr:unnamed protein product [Polarella glacialis]